MIYDVLDVFKKEYEKSGDALILGLYTLKDGLYVKVAKDGKCEYFEAKTIKREKVFSTINGQQNSKAFEWFKERDYYSSISDTSKAFDAPKKTIHNNNYLTLFMKIEKFINTDFTHIKDKLFKKVIGYKDFKSKNEKNILKIYCYEIQSLARKKDLLHKYRILEDIFEDMKELSKEYNPKIYLKIFFDEDIKMYKKESEIYFALKVFNDNKYSIDVNNIVYGLSNSNLGLNAKKPYLENKTKKFSKPFMVTNSDALLLKKFFDWLKIQPYNNKDRYLDEHFFIQKQSKNDEAEIKEFDYIPIKSDDVNKSFEPIKVKNYLKIVDKDKKLINDSEIKELYHLEKVVDEVFYNKQLIFNYYRDAKDIKVSGFLSKELQKLLFITKYSMNNYFRKFDDKSFKNTVKKYATAFVLDSLRNGRVFKAKNALNLKFAILGEEMDVEKTLSVLEKRLLQEGNYENMQRDEFMFLSGQWAYYLLRQSNSIDKTFALAEHYFKAKNIQRLKKALTFDFEKYKHAIHRESKKNRKVIALLKSYDSDVDRLSDSDKDMFLVGFTVDSLMYNKKETKK